MGRPGHEERCPGPVSGLLEELLVRAPVSRFGRSYAVPAFSRLSHSVNNLVRSQHQKERHVGLLLFIWGTNALTANDWAPCNDGVVAGVMVEKGYAVYRSGFPLVLGGTRHPSEMQYPPYITFHLPVAARAR